MSPSPPKPPTKETLLDPVHEESLAVSKKPEMVGEKQEGVPDAHLFQDRVLKVCPFASSAHRCSEPDISIYFDGSDASSALAGGGASPANPGEWSGWHHQSGAEGQAERGETRRWSKL